MRETMNRPEQTNGKQRGGAGVTMADAVVTDKEATRPAVWAQSVESFWHAPEPRVPRRPDDYLGRVVAWFHPPVDPERDDPKHIEGLLETAQEKAPLRVRLLRWIYHNHVVRAALEYTGLQEAVRQRIAQQNAWIEAENGKAAAEEPPARERLEKAEAELDEAEQNASRTCSAVGFAYRPGQTEAEHVAAVPPELEARHLTATTPELEAAAEPVRARGTLRWIGLFAPIPLGCILGVALFHFAGFLRGDALPKLQLVWRQIAIAWLCIGTPLYYVLGNGLRAAARRVYWWREELGADEATQRKLLRWGIGLLALMAAVPLLTEAVVEAAAFQHLNAELRGLTEMVVNPDAYSVPAPAAIIFYVAGALMASLFVLSEFWTAYNDEEDHVVERRNRLTLAQQRTSHGADAHQVRVEVAQAAAERLHNPELGEALAAVALAVQWRRIVARLRGELDSIRGRRQDPIWVPDPATQGRIDDARAAACGSATWFERLLVALVRDLEHIKDTGGEEHRAETYGAAARPWRRWRKWAWIGMLLLSAPALLGWWLFLTGGPR